MIYRINGKIFFTETIHWQVSNFLYNLWNLLIFSSLLGMCRPIVHYGCGVRGDQDCWNIDVSLIVVCSTVP